MNVGEIAAQHGEGRKITEADVLAACNAYDDERIGENMAEYPAMYKALETFCSPPHVADALDGEREWRVGWACSYSGANLYSDDGELQDNLVQPFIDWLHDSAADISRKIEVRSQKQAAAIAARAEAGDQTNKHAGLSGCDGATHV
jgi:hypothetical protein